MTKGFKGTRGRLLSCMLAGSLMAGATPAAAWDQSGHMITANIAFSEIARTDPELIRTIGELLSQHPDSAPFIVAAGDATGIERVRRMFVECARWPDDARFGPYDRPSWHSGRKRIVAEGSSPQLRERLASHKDETRGQLLEALALNNAVLANPEAKPAERALAMCWVLHLSGDIHEPMHVAELYSDEYPNGNLAGLATYVMDPMKSGSTIPLHMLWDSNALRSSDLGDVDRESAAMLGEFKRSSFPELKEKGDHDFVAWADEGYGLAVSFVYGSHVVMARDPGSDNADQAMKNVVRWKVEGVSPVASAPAVPPAYWERVKHESRRRITLAGYRIAGLVVSALGR